MSVTHRHRDPQDPPAAPMEQAHGHRRRSFLFLQREKTILGKEPKP